MQRQTPFDTHGACAVFVCVEYTVKMKKNKHNFFLFVLHKLFAALVII